MKQPGSTTANPMGLQFGAPAGLAPKADFPTTHWSLVLAAGHGSERSGPALEALCRTYWVPLYAFVRRQGHDVHAAQDLTQEFFARLLAGDSLLGVRPAKGRFRSYLLAAMKHFLANEWDRARALKRGGGCEVFSLDQISAEENRGVEPADAATPDKLFERRWAETVLERVNARLRREYEAADQAQRFEVLKMYLLGDGEAASYADTARRLSLTESAVKSAIYKLRQRYGEMFRAEVAHTVAGPEEVENEIRWLLSALSD